MHKVMVFIDYQNFFISWKQKKGEIFRKTWKQLYLIWKLIKQLNLLIVPMK